MKAFAFFLTFALNFHSLWYSFCVSFEIKTKKKTDYSIVQYLYYTLFENLVSLMLAVPFPFEAFQLIRELLGQIQTFVQVV